MHAIRATDAGPSNDGIMVGYGEDRINSECRWRYSEEAPPDAHGYIHRGSADQAFFCTCLRRGTRRLFGK